MAAAFPPCSAGAPSLLGRAGGEASGGEAIKAPASKVDKQTHDFGKCKRSEVKRHTFYVTNTGDAPLLILHVSTACGCTTTSYTTKSIKPGKRGKIEVEFNPASQPPGPFRKVITVYLNTIHAYTRVFIKGDIQD